MAQAPLAVLAEVAYDPFVEAEKSESGGTLLAHNAVPLLEEDGV